MNTLKGSLQKTLLTVLFTMFSAQVAHAMAKLPPEENPAPKPPPVPAPAPKPPSPAPAPPVQGPTSANAPLWDTKATDGKKWTAHVLNALDTLGADLLDVIPADAATFCPNYNKLSYGDRKQVWAFLMSAMVKYESNFKPSTTYQEDFNDAHGDPVISRGLLQISIESSQSYGCGFRKAEELHDPELNLDCGIRILNRWMAKDGRIGGKVDGGWKGGARYWSVLRTTSKSYSSVVSLTKAIPLCKN